MQYKPNRIAAVPVDSDTHHQQQFTRERRCCWKETLPEVFGLKLMALDASHDGLLAANALPVDLQVTSVHS